LDYDKEDWLHCAWHFWSDLREGNVHKFEDWTDVVVGRADRIPPHVRTMSSSLS